MTNRWVNLELPVLTAAVELADEMLPRSGYPAGRDIASRAGLDIDDVGIALNALEGEYLVLQRSGGFASWGVPRVTSEARRAVGQWPTAEGLVEQLAAGLARAAETETEPERRSRLLALAEGLGGFARDVAVGVVVQMSGGVIPHI